VTRRDGMMTSAGGEVEPGGREETTLVGLT
jgi:hypothetical protein